MWPSPPLFFAVPRLRSRDATLPVVPFALAFVLHVIRCASPAYPVVSGHLRRFCSDGPPVCEGAPSSVYGLSLVVESIGTVARKCSIGPVFVQCGVWGGGTSRMRDGEEAPWPAPPHGTRTTSSSSQASSLLSSLPCVLHLPSISKMVIVYVWYSRVCVASKIVSSHFVAVGGTKGQPLCRGSMLSGNSGCASVSKEG
jgi:hypothetical protein